MKPQEVLRRTVEELLRLEKVDLVIGYERGSLPLRTTPCFLRDPRDADRLVWDATCENNLSAYLKERKEKIAIVAKSCDVRSILVAAAENQVALENLVVISGPCRGVIDRKKIAERTGDREVRDAEIGEETISVAGRGFEIKLPVEHVLSDSCLECDHRDPPICHVRLEEAPAQPSEQQQSTEVQRLESLSSEQRWAHFQKEFDRCIRCYACRNACPLCYCKECIVDWTNPSWFGKGSHPADVMMFHIARVIHLAGRCVDCGACTRACPMAINIGALSSKLQKYVKEEFGYEPGMDVKTAPPLASYSKEDRDDFIT